MRADGSGARPVSRPRLGDAQPAWSPDGDLIAFVATYDGDDGVTTDVYAVPAGGGRQRNLTRSPAASERQLAWSRDGTLLAYTRTYLRDDQVIVTTGDGAPALDVSRATERSDTWAAFGPRHATLP
jgi:Tol biopolymer transport system component